MKYFRNWAKGVNTSLNPGTPDYTSSPLNPRVRLTGPEPDELGVSRLKLMPFNSPKAISFNPTLICEHWWCSHHTCPQVLPRF